MKLFDFSTEYQKSVSDGVALISIRSVLGGWLFDWHQPVVLGPCMDAVHLERLRGTVGSGAWGKLNQVLQKYPTSSHCIPF